MKILFLSISILCCLIEIICYFELKKYIKMHGEELVENNAKGLYKRCVILIAIPIVPMVFKLILIFAGL